MAVLALTGLALTAQEQQTRQTEELQVGKQTYHGTISAMDADKLTLKNKKGDKTKTFKITGAKVTVDKAPATIADIKVGDHARVTATATSTDTAEEIAVWRKKSDEAALAALNASNGGKASEFTGKTWGLKAGEMASISINCQAGKEITLSVRSEQKSDVNLHVYNRNTLRTIAKDDSEGSSCDLLFTPTESGNYIIQVINLGPGANRSTLKIEKIQ